MPNRKRVTRKKNYSSRHRSKPTEKNFTKEILLQLLNDGGQKYPTSLHNGSPAMFSELLAHPNYPAGATLSFSDISHEGVAQLFCSIDPNHWPKNLRIELDPSELTNETVLFLIELYSQQCCPPGLVIQLTNRGLTRLYSVDRSLARELNNAVYVHNNQSTVTHELAVTLAGDYLRPKDKKQSCHFAKLPFDVKEVIFSFMATVPVISRRPKDYFILYLVAERALLLTLLEGNNANRTLIGSMRAHAEMSELEGPERSKIVTDHDAKRKQIMRQFTCGVIALQEKESNGKLPSQRLFNEVSMRPHNIPIEQKEAQAMADAMRSVSAIFGYRT